MNDYKKRNRKGDGTFRKNKSGTITYILSVGYTDSGYKKRLQVTCRTERECRQEMAKRIEEWKQQQNNPDQLFRGTVCELCIAHLEYQTANEELTAKSIDRRETTVYRHIGDYRIGGVQASDITSVMVENHVSQLILEHSLSASSIQKVVDVLSAAYSWAISRGLLQKNPVEPVKSSMLRRIAKLSEKTANDADVIVLSSAEQRRLEEYAFSDTLALKRGELFQLYDLFLMKTGLRVGELIACRWSDYNPSTHVLTIRKSQVVARNRNRQADEDSHTVRIEKSTKNQKARNIELFSDAVQIINRIRELSKWTSPEDFIAATRTGKANTATSMIARTRNVFQKAGIYVDDKETGSTHVFRRTFATVCYYERGIPIKTLAAYMGDLESTILKYYIAAREKMVSADDEIQQVIRLKAVSNNAERADD